MLELLAVGHRVAVQLMSATTNVTQREPGDRWFWAWRHWIPLSAPRSGVNNVRLERREMRRITTV